MSTVSCGSAVPNCVRETNSDLVKVSDSLNDSSGVWLEPIWLQKAVQGPCNYCFHENSISLALARESSQLAAAFAEQFFLSTAREAEGIVWIAAMLLDMWYTSCSFAMRNCVRCSEWWVLKVYFSLKLHNTVQCSMYLILLLRRRISHVLVLRRLRASNWFSIRSRNNRTGS